MCSGNSTILDDAPEECAIYPKSGEDLVLNLKKLLNLLVPIRSITQDCSKEVDVPIIVQLFEHHYLKNGVLRELGFLNLCFEGFLVPSLEKDCTLLRECTITWLCPGRNHCVGEVHRASAPVLSLGACLLWGLGMLCYLAVDHVGMCIGFC